MAIRPKDASGAAVLNAREFKFVEMYVVGETTMGNAAASGRAAGYTWDTANTYAHLWIKGPNDPGTPNPKPHIYEAICKRRDEVAARRAATPERIIQEMERLAMFNTSKFNGITSDGDPYIDVSAMTEDDWAAVAETQVEDYYEGRGEDARLVKRVKVKAHPKAQALDMLAKVHGLYKPIKTLMGSDPDNPLPGGMATPDISRLTPEELEIFLPLFRKVMGQNEPSA